MPNKLVFVQFMHPGAEHTLDTGRQWNSGPHRRKFMRTAGAYLHDGRSHTDDVLLWGEWEAQSEVLAEWTPTSADTPQYLYRPFYTPPATYYQDPPLQNTDPFVFGDQFQYTGCQQNTRRGPTSLRYLDRGSVILFGSCREDRFRLDTALVVRDWIDHHRGNFRQALQGRISPTYAAVTISPWYREDFAHLQGTAGRGGGCATGESFRLYFGATIDEPVDGMFSFFPCLPYQSQTRGFEHPTIRIPEAITDNHRQWKRLTSCRSTADARRLWCQVVDQVTAAGLLLGVRADLPPCIPAAGTVQPHEVRDRRSSVAAGCGSR